jgi:hypothetical protein
MVNRAIKKRILLYSLIFLLTVSMAGTVHADSFEVEKEQLKKTIGILLKMMETKSGHEKRIYTTSILEAITKLYQVYDDKDFLQFIPALYRKDIKPFYDIGFSSDGSLKLMRAEASNKLFQTPPFSYYAVFDLTIENQSNETLYLTEVSFYLVDIYGKKYRNLSLLPNDLKKAAQDGGKEPSDFVFDKILPHATVGKHIVFPLPITPIQSLNMEDAKKENNVTVILWEGVIQEITGN